MVVLPPAEHPRALNPVGRGVVVVPLDVVWRLVKQVGLGELGVKVGDRLVRVDVGLERRRDLTLGEEVPVDRLEEGVLLELCGVALGAEAVLRVAVQELRGEGTASQSVDGVSCDGTEEETHALDKLLAVFANHSSRELDLAETAAGTGRVSQRTEERRGPKRT